ncbi:unnamed protein product, partial [marine sediment metagenome]
EVTDQFYQKILKNLKGTKLLNIGCGKYLIPRFIKSKNIKAFGLDIDEAVLSKRILKTDINKDPFPFADNEFDFVVSLWSVEHFSNFNFLIESQRVLKKDGYFIFVTPNVLYPIMLANKILPYSWSDYLRKKLGKWGSNDPAFYRFNNYHIIKREARKAGFIIERIDFAGPANALNYSENPFFQKVCSTWERIINNPVLFWLKPILIVSLRKD